MTSVIMVVSKNEKLIKRIHTLLADHGLLFTADAHSSKELLEIIKKDQPNIVIVDLFMGNESGLDILKILEKTKLEISTILLSPIDTRSLLERGFRTGAKDILKLPVQDEELLSCVLHRKREFETVTF